MVISKKRANLRKDPVLPNFEATEVTTGSTEMTTSIADYNRNKVELISADQAAVMSYHLLESINKLLKEISKKLDKL